MERTNASTSALNGAPPMMTSLMFPPKRQAFRACLFLDLFADDGDVQKQLAQFAVDFRKDFFLEYLFDDQWHTRHDAGMKLCHGGHDDLGRRHAREEIQVGTETYAIEEVVDQTEHVSHGQHGYDIVAGRDADGTVAEQHVGHEAAVGKHDPFGESRGARSIIDDGELFW